MYIPFNSRYEYHKSKFGAVRAGDEITFRIVMPRNFGVTGASLAVRADNDGEFRYFRMKWDCMQGNDEEWWKVSYTPDTPGLYWYHFVYETAFGRSVIMRYEGGKGTIGAGGSEWQLTAADRLYKTPDWLKGGVMYQIFPDRFYKSGKTEKYTKNDRILRDDWGNEPYWKPDEKGITRNNDFFGGDLKGIEEKLPYLQALGVTCLYLNPIFAAQSNHRYDTGDYSKIDPMLGEEKDFISLCKKAGDMGIHILLDGVFSHTGADSRYFNKYGTYDSVGAYQSKESPYYPWYTFKHWNEDYACWWGIKILPEVKEENPDYIEFITGENGIAAKWLRCGASGWRLDVADELPDVFLDALNRRVKKENPNALILGEVWEDASNKFSYGARRRYLQGGQLDSVMNYPFANAIVYFVRTGDTQHFSESILSILENYPAQTVNVLMNHIGSHDTARIINVLAGDPFDNRDRAWQSGRKLTNQQYEKGIQLVAMAAAIQYTLPGVPSLYYGDEIATQGYKDPFNRACFDWASSEKRLLRVYTMLGEMRKKYDCFADGRFEILSDVYGCIAYARHGRASSVLVIANRNEHEIDYYLPEYWQNTEVLTGGAMCGGYVKIPAVTCAILVIDDKQNENEYRAADRDVH